MPRVGVTADLRVQVPRNDQGTLVDGARSVVERVDAVDAVDTVDVTSVRPDLNTVHTDVRVDLTLAIDDAPVDDDAVADTLCEGFGVQRVDVCGIRDVGPPH